MLTAEQKESLHIVQAALEQMAGLAVAANSALVKAAIPGLEEVPLNRIGAMYWDIKNRFPGEL